MRLASAVSVAALFTAVPALAVDLDFMISDVDGKANIIAEFARRYQETHPDVNITLNSVGYNVIREQLPVQLEAGTGPNFAFVTDLGGLNPYYVDLTPYVDADAWEAAYGAVLPWYRAGKPDGIYGFHTEMTVTGPYVNLTMFEEAGVDLPAPGATWEEWADATRQVMDNIGSYAGMVMDRSGHRFAGPAMSYGAKYFDDDGALVLDEGYETFFTLMVEWHRDGLMPARCLARHGWLEIRQRERDVLQPGCALLHVRFLEHRQRSEECRRQFRLDRRSRALRTGGLRRDARWRGSGGFQVG